MRNVSLFLVCGFIGVAALGQVKVKSQSLEVYESRNTRSAVVKNLKQGDEVVIEMSITGEDNAQWCSIRESGQKARLGYVRCEFLERPAPKTAESQAAAAPAAPAGTQRAAAVGTGPSDFWDPLHRGTAGESRWMGYARILASTFKFTEQQKQQVLQLATQNGIPGCIERDDSYWRRGLQPPDLLSGSPITPCSWYFQRFSEQVFALITAEQRAAARASYDSFSREVAGNRRVLELKSKSGR